MSRLNREESIEVLTLMIRANRRVASKALGMSRVALKNDKQYDALQLEIRMAETDTRQAAFETLKKVGILDPSLSWEEVRHMR